MVSKKRRLVGGPLPKPRKPGVKLDPLPLQLQPPAPPGDLADQLEAAMRAAISPGRLPAVAAASEDAYCTALLEALDVIREGAEMRLGELAEDERPGEEK